MENTFAGRWTFDNKDMEGTWVRHTFYYNNYEKEGGWDYGTIICDDKGNIIGGESTDCEGDSSSVTGGTYSLGEDGTFTATIELDDGYGTKTVDVKGTMNMSKDTMVTMDINSNMTSSITVLVKKPWKKGKGSQK
jgi:hypothetical protein